jgi:hypothetical protein
MARAVGTSTAAVGDTTPMDLDALKIQIKALGESLKSLVEKGECWHYGKVGHRRAQCDAYKRNMAEKAEKDKSGKVETQ